MKRTEVCILFLCIFFGSFHGAQRPKSSDTPQKKQPSINISNTQNQKPTRLQRTYLTIPKKQTNQNSIRSQDEIYYSEKSSSFSDDTIIPD